MKIFITGASGYIGGSLAAALMRCRTPSERIGALGGKRGGA